MNDEFDNDLNSPIVDLILAAIEDGDIETVGVCQICLQPSTRSVCDGCESTGGLFGDWRSDSDG